MSPQPDGFDNYFAHLTSISFVGRAYKRCVTSPILYACARRHGKRILEIGSGVGSGILGTFPGTVSGLDVNPAAVGYCQAKGMKAQLIAADGSFPVANGAFDACVLDNVLEHIDDPRQTLDECHRITSPGGGLVIAVPGIAGYRSDDDHKKFYEANGLKQLDSRWAITRMFATPFLLRSERLSVSVKQYCLVASYRRL